jgi:hypothetical protein
MQDRLSTIWSLAVAGAGARPASAHIAEFFAIEKDIRDRSAEERLSFDNREAGRSQMHSRSGYAQSLV